MVCLWRLLPPRLSPLNPPLWKRKHRCFYLGVRPTPTGMIVRVVGVVFQEGLQFWRRVPERTANSLRFPNDLYQSLNDGDWICTVRYKRHAVVPTEIKIASRFLLLKYLYETRATVLENSSMGGGRSSIQFANWCIYRPNRYCSGVRVLKINIIVRAALCDTNNKNMVFYSYEKVICIFDCSVDNRYGETR